MPEEPGAPGGDARVAPLLTALTLHTRLYANCLAGMSDEAASQRPSAQTNSAAFIAAHVADSRFFLAAVVGVTPANPLAERLAGAATRVCTVAGFPLGATLAEVKAIEAARAIADGACEVDMVMNVGALKSGDYRTVERDIAGVVEACRRGGALSKVIIEAALLTDEEKVQACVIARAACADFVKTSTGFGPGGATAADVALMRRVVGSEMGVKAAGGVRDLKSAQAMLEAGADRIGASVGVKIVQESRSAGQ
jgi:deoxyribose-phosphate aldolase